MCPIIKYDKMLHDWEVYLHKTHVSGNTAHQYYKYEYTVCVAFDIKDTGYIHNDQTTIQMYNGAMIINR